MIDFRFKLLRKQWQASRREAQKLPVRFATATGLISQLVEAQHPHLLGRALKRWSRDDLAVIDEIGYVPIAEIGAEYLFQ